MIQTTGLTKEYDGKAVVHQLDLHIRPGEIYGFLGPNGAGKSTTIAMILGLLKPTRGKVLLFGKELRSEYFSIKRKIGVVGEFQHFYEELTGFEYLSFFADLYQVKKKEQRIDELLAMVDLVSAQNLRLKAYSKGMQQKLAFVRALLHDPELLILDEPVSSLDPYGIKEVRGIIMAEHRRGKTIFISSHILSEIEKTCDRVGIINRGRLVAEDTMDHLRRKLRDDVELEVELEVFSPQVEEVLRRLEFVRDVAVAGNILKIKVISGKDYRAEISRTISGAGALVLALKINEMSLEEAFVTITERNITLLTEEAV